MYSIDDSVHFSDCHNIITDRQGAIESPNFPSPYSLDLNCDWKLIPKPGNNISIEFTHFDLERTSDNCAYDYVAIEQLSTDGNVLISDRYCNEMPKRLETNRPVLIKYV